MNKFKFAYLGAVAAAAISLGGAADAQASVLTVNATDVIYAAGGQANALNGTGGTTPSFINVTSGSTLTFSATGSVVLNLTSGNNSNDADGVGAAPGTSSNSGYGSISGINAPNAGYLVGVFIPSGGATGAAPASLDFTSGGGTSFASLSPQLDQVFFIGDGLTGDGTGAPQTFFAPTGASTLYLGISDACGYNGSPSCYGDNSRSFSVTINSSVSSAVPEPSTWAMMLLGMAGLGFLGYRRQRMAFAA